jgi:hypothetical protein
MKLCQNCEKPYLRRMFGLLVGAEADSLNYWNY